MKFLLYVILGMMLMMTLLAACGGEDETTDIKQVDNTANSNNLPDSTISTNVAVADITPIVASYLEMKNELAADDSREAATAGLHMIKAIEAFDKTTLNAELSKEYDDIASDAREHATHISTNPDRIRHQREHFEMLSSDIYDLAKMVKPNQVLYYDFCPMYNDNKGGYWLSEKKDISNPYLGKEMLTCGTVKEELR